MRALSRSVDIPISSHRAVLLRVLVLLAITMAVLMPLID
jgi:hypothetical protein